MHSMNAARNMEAMFCEEKECAIPQDAAREKAY
jgi:hypothetical protein